MNTEQTNENILTNKYCHQSNRIPNGHLRKFRKLTRFAEISAAFLPLKHVCSL